MGQNRPKIMITTSHDPVDQSRRFCKVLSHIIPNSFVFNRGNRNLDAIHLISMENLADYVYFVHSKEQRVHKLVITKIYADKLEKIGSELEILQYIDHKIFGFDRLPASGPLSTSLLARQENRELLDYFDKYFQLEFDKKNQIWLMLDVDTNKNTTYIAFVDALTQNKFFFAEVKLIHDQQK